MSTELEDTAEQASHSAQSLSIKLLGAFPVYNSEFEAKWQSWQEAISPSADPSTWSLVAQFDALVALGPKVIPIVLWKMVAKYPRDTSTTAVYLYNKLGKDPTYLVSGEDLADQIDGILKKNFRRNRLIRNAILDWAEHCDMVSRSSSSAFYTDCDEYEALVNLGLVVIPHLMLKYKKTFLKEDSDGVRLTFAYELLHEILWGEQTELQTIFMDQQYKMWVEWFEKKDYHQAPRFREGRRVQ